MFMLINKIFKKTITQKLIAVILFIFILQTGLILWLSSTQLRSKLYAQVEQDVRTLLIHTQENIQYLNGQNSSSQIKKVVSSLGVNYHLKKAIYFNDESTVSAATNIGLINTKIDNHFSFEQLTILKLQFDKTKKTLKNTVYYSENKNTLFGITPIKLGRTSPNIIRADKIGILYLEYDMKWINRQVRYNAMQSLTPIMLLLFISSIGLVVFFKVHISQRIKNINDAASVFSKSDYSERIKIRGHDEIRDLSLAFNVMAEEIETQHEKLIAHGQRLSEAQNMAHIGNWELDIVNNKLTWSDECFRIFCQDKTSFKTSYDAFLNLIHPEDIMKVDLAYQDSLKDKQPYSVDHRICLPDGTIKYLHERCETIYNSKGEPVLSRGTAQDITEHTNMEETIRRTQKMDALGKLTGGIAHDFNNILGIVMGYAELLVNSLKNQPQLSQYASEIQHASERGASLTKKLLGFSRKKSSNICIVNTNDLLQTQKLMLEKTLTARIKLKYILKDEIWSIYVDDNELEDATVNLCINAMHAIENNGIITIKTDNIHLQQAEAQRLNLKHGEYVIVTITDTGTGMDLETKEKIFEPFYSTKGEMGTGLGLSQVYGFTQRSQGSIEVDSQVNHGTSFTMYFPRYHYTVNEAESSNDNKINKSSGVETILITDDEISLLHLTKEILSLKGYNVLCAENGAQALEILKSEQVDLLLSDVIMPEMDGYQLCAIVKEKYPNIKIQLASGFSESENKDLVDEELYKNKINKPFRAKELLERIRGLLDE